MKSPIIKYILFIFILASTFVSHEVYAAKYVAMNTGRYSCRCDQLGWTDTKQTYAFWNRACKTISANINGHIQTLSVPYCPVIAKFKIDDDQLMFDGCTTDPM